MTKENKAMHPFMYSLKNLFNGRYLNEFYEKAQDLITDEKVITRNYTSQSVSDLKNDILLLEDMIESPEYISGYDYAQNIEDLTLRIAARAYIINNDTCN
jgi:hypothetical protein